MSKKDTKNSEGKKLYELSFLLKDPSNEKLILDLLTGFKVSITKEPKISSIKLAYPIKKHTSAYFGYINFEANPSVIKEISDNLRLNSEVLRFLIIASPVVKKVESGDKRSENKKSNKKEDDVSVTLTNEALEEQLEEILK